MVMSLEGYVYYVSKVYSYWGETDTSSGDGKEGDCDVIDPFNDRLDRNAGNAKKVPQSTDKNVVDKTKASPVKPSAASSDASAQYYEGGHYDNKPVFAGEAAVINGVVTTMAGPRKEKYDSAVFEFVVAYDQTSNAAVTALDPNVA
jgi:hypothetical protein